MNFRKTESELRDQQDHYWYEIRHFVSWWNLTACTSEVGRSDGTHCLKRTTLKRNHYFTVCASCFGKDAERWKCSVVNFYRPLSFTDGLNNPISLILTTSSFDKHRLECDGDARCDRNLLHLWLRSEARMLFCQHHVYDLEEADMVAYDGWWAAGASLRHIWMGRCVGWLGALLFLSSPQVFLIIVYILQS